MQTRSQWSIHRQPVQCCWSWAGLLEERRLRRTQGLLSVLEPGSRIHHLFGAMLWFESAEWIRWIRFLLWFESVKWIRWIRFLLWFESAWIRLWIRFMLWFESMNPLWIRWIRKWIRWIRLRIHESVFESANPYLNPWIRFWIRESLFEPTNISLNAWIL